MTDCGSRNDTDGDQARWSYNLAAPSRSEGPTLHFVEVSCAVHAATVWAAVGNQEKIM